MYKYDICYGYLDSLENDKSMWWYEEAENMAEMIRILVKDHTSELKFTILDLSEQRATIYIPAADVNNEGEFRRIYLYGRA